MKSFASRHLHVVEQLSCSCHGPNGPLAHRTATARWHGPICLGSPRTMISTSCSHVLIREKDMRPQRCSRCRRNCSEPSLGDLVRGDQDLDPQMECNMESIECARHLMEQGAHRRQLSCVVINSNDRKIFQRNFEQVDMKLNPPTFEA